MDYWLDEQNPKPPVPETPAPLNVDNIPGVSSPNVSIIGGFFDGLYTGFKAVANATSSLVTSTLTVGQFDYQVFEVTDKDELYGYRPAEFIGKIGVGAGFMAGSMGLGCAAAQGSRLAAGAVGTLDGLAAVSAVDGVVSGFTDMYENGVTVGNATQVGLSIATLGLLGSKACFTEGTQVVVGAEYTEDGVFVQYVTMNIEDVQVGDLVYSYDTLTGETELKEVTAVFVRETDHINYLTIADENGNVQVIETTDSHPFWVVTDDPDLSRAARNVVDENGIILYHENLEPGLNGFWVEAKDLREGDVFIGANGELSTLVAMERVEFPDGIKVYNFTVDGNHDYFVIAKDDSFGQTCILVHNANPCAAGGAANANRVASRAAGIPDSQLGPSGLPKIHSPFMGSIKKAKDAALAAAGKGGTVMQHVNPKKGISHFHPVTQGGKKLRVHFGYNN